MDYIFLKDLIFYGKHGCYSWEKKKAQGFRVNAKVYFDMSRASKSDDYHDTVDWAQLKNIAQEVVGKERYNLVEKMADEVAERFLVLSEQIEKVEVCIEKLEGWETGTRGVCLSRVREK